MTPDESMAELVRMFSGPQPPRPDGVIEFVRDPFDAEMERISASRPRRRSASICRRQVLADEMLVVG
jgi:hypothetical protein